MFRLSADSIKKEARRLGFLVGNTHTKRKGSWSTVTIVLTRMDTDRHLTQKDIRRLKTSIQTDASPNLTFTTNNYEDDNGSWTEFTVRSSRN